MSDDRSREAVDSAPPNRRLDSWKAIADYLGRHVTTLQRWEHDEALPVRRHYHEKRGSVYAYTTDLDQWLLQRSVGSAPDTALDERLDASSSSLPAGSHGTTASSGQPDALKDALAEHRHRAVSTGAPSARERLRFPVWAIAAAVAVGLTMAAGLAKDRWAATDGDQALTLAVLPLSNRSPDLQPNYFVDGMTEALTTDLASVRGIRVIARQSVMQYRETSKLASTIAGELGVSALVEGAVYRSGQRLRVDVRLIDGATSRSLWASTYERDLSEALALPADISRAIVSELHVPIPPSQGNARENRRPSNPEAWDAYLRARFFWNRRTHDDMGRAIEWYERAIQLDSSSPLLYAGLADVYATLGPRDAPVSELIARGTAAANRAIGLDPRMGEPYAALGKLRAYDWDWSGAESHYRKAIERTPGYAPGRYWFGSFLANQGRCVEALEEAHEAERLDPVSLPGNMVIAGIELKCDRVPRAVTRVKMITEFDPSFGQAYDYLGRAYLLQGDTTGAIAMFKRAQSLTGGRATIEAALGFAYARAGRKAEAEAIANTLAARRATDKVLASAWSVAMVHAGLENDEAALTWLERAYADREEWLEALGADERFRGLHTNDRFQRLVYRLGLAGSKVPN